MIRFPLSKNTSQRSPTNEPSTLSPIRRVLSPFRRRHHDEKQGVDHVTTNKRLDMTTTTAKAQPTIKQKNKIRIKVESTIPMVVERKAPVLAPTHRVLPALPDQPKQRKVPESNLSLLTRSLSSLKQEREQVSRFSKKVEPKAVAPPTQSARRRQPRRSPSPECIKLCQHLTAVVPRRNSTGGSVHSLQRGSLSSISSSPSLNDSMSTASPIFVPLSRRRGPLDDMLEREHEQEVHRREDLLGMSEHVHTPQPFSHVPIAKKSFEKKVNTRTAKPKTAGLLKSSQRNGKAGKHIATAKPHSPPLGKGMQRKPSLSKKKLLSTSTQSSSSSALQIDVDQTPKKRSLSDRNLLISPSLSVSRKPLSERNLLNSSLSSASDRNLLKSAPSAGGDRSLSARTMTRDSSDALPNRRALSARNLMKDYSSPVPPANRRSTSERYLLQNSPPPASFPKYLSDHLSDRHQFQMTRNPPSLQEKRRNLQQMKRQLSNRTLTAQLSPSSSVNSKISIAGRQQRLLRDVNENLLSSHGQKRASPRVRDKDTPGSPTGKMRSPSISPIVQASPLSVRKVKMSPSPRKGHIVTKGRMDVDQDESSVNSTPLTPSKTAKLASVLKHRSVKTSACRKGNPRKKKTRRASMLYTKDKSGTGGPYRCVEPKRSGSLRDLRIKSRDGPSVEAEEDDFCHSPLDRSCPELMSMSSKCSWGDLTCEVEPAPRSPRQGYLKPTLSSTSWGDLSLFQLAAVVDLLVGENHGGRSTHQGSDDVTHKPRRGRRPKHMDCANATETTSESTNSNTSRSKRANLSSRSRKIVCSVPEEAMTIKSFYRGKGKSDDNSSDSEPNS